MVAWMKDRGCCDLCRENDAALLDFHHIDPTTKTAKVARLHSVMAIILEAEKCVLLCKSCHKAVHADPAAAEQIRPLDPLWIDQMVTEYARHRLLNGE